MYSYQHIHYLDLPQVPAELTNSLPKNIDEYQCVVMSESYKWTDSFNADLNAWCHKHISNSVYWAFQIITGDLKIHRDKGTNIKMNYLISNGGDDVHTLFWDDENKLINDYVVPVNKWHLLKADTLHSVQGVEQNKIRWAITGRVF